MKQLIENQLRLVRAQYWLAAVATRQAINTQTETDVDAARLEQQSYRNDVRNLHRLAEMASEEDQSTVELELCELKPLPRPPQINWEPAA